MRYIVLLTVIMLVFAGGCYYDSEEVLYPNSFCDTVNVTYSGTIAPIVESRCATPGCHVPGGDGTGDFTTYAGLMGQIENNGPLLPSIRQEPDAIPMPVDGSLRSCEISQFEIWIAAGAPNN